MSQVLVHCAYLKMAKKRRIHLRRKKISACFDPSDGWQWTYISSTILGNDLFSLVSVDETMIVFKIEILDNEGSISTISTTEEVPDEPTNRPKPTDTPKMTSTPATLCSSERQIDITVGIGEKVELTEYIHDEYCAKMHQPCSPVRSTGGKVYAKNGGREQNVFNPKTRNCFDPSRNKWLYVANGLPGNDTFSVVSRDNTKLTFDIVIEEKVCQLRKQINLTVRIGEELEITDYIQADNCAKVQQTCLPVHPTSGKVYAKYRGKNVRFNVFNPKTWNCFNLLRYKWLYVPNGLPGKDTFSTVSRDNTKLRFDIVIERSKLVERTCVTKALIELNATIGRTLDVTSYLKNGFCTAATVSNQCLPVKPSVGTVKGKRRYTRMGTFDPFVRNTCFKPNIYRWTYVASESTPDKEDSFSVILSNNEKLDFKIKIKVEPWLFPILADDAGQNGCQVTNVYLNVTATKTVGLNKYLGKERCTGVHNLCTAMKPSQGVLGVKNSDPFESPNLGKCWNANRLKWTYTSLNDKDGQDEFSVVSLSNTKWKFVITIIKEVFTERPCVTLPLIELEATVGEELDVTSHLKGFCTTAKDQCLPVKPSLGSVIGNRRSTINPFEKAGCFNRNGYTWSYIANSTTGEDTFSILVDNKKQTFEIKIEAIKQSSCVSNDVVYLNVTATKTLDITEYLGTEYCTSVQNLCSAKEPQKGDLGVRNTNRLDPFETTGCYNPKSGSKWTYTSLFDTDGQDVFSVISRTGTKQTFNISIFKDCIQQKGESKRVTVHVLGKFVLEELTPDNVCTKVQTARTCRIKTPEIGKLTTSLRTTIIDPYKNKGCYSADGTWTYKAQQKAGKDRFSFVSPDCCHSVEYVVNVIELNDKNSVCGLKDKEFKGIQCRNVYSRDCPNTYRCVKRKACCRYSDVPACETILNESYGNETVPWACRGGNSRRCPEGFSCYTHPKNVYTMCCKITQCTDKVGQIHRPEDGDFKDPIDKCNNCKCLKNGEIQCTDKLACKQCKVPNMKALQPRGYTYNINNGCDECVCVSSPVTNCKGPCELEGGKVTAWSGDSPCTEEYGLSVKIKHCSNTNLVHKSETCSITKTETKECNPLLMPKTGIRKTEAAPLVIGGKKVSPARNYRWMARLSHIESPHGLLCGGSVISRLHVLTAAHCICLNCGGCVVRENQLVPLMRGCSFRVTVGDHSISTIENAEQVRDSFVMQVHRNYNSTSFDNDIAILTLERPLIFNDDVQPVLLPKIPPGILKLSKRYCTVVGWGLTGPQEGISDELQEAGLYLDETCSRASIVTTDNMICANVDRSKADSCYGDSGGGFSCRLFGPKYPWAIFGIVSTGSRRCGANGGGAYTKVQNYVDWIEEHISTDGSWGKWSSYTPCSELGQRSRSRVCTDPLPISLGSCKALNGEKKNIEVDTENC